MNTRTDEAVLIAARDALLAGGEKDELTPLEQQAASAAAQAAGGWLAEEVGHFDFAAMDDGQRDEFLRRIIVGYRNTLRRLVADQPPF